MNILKFLVMALIVLFLALAFSLYVGDVGEERYARRVADRLKECTVERDLLATSQRLPAEVLHYLVDTGRSQCVSRNAYAPMTRMECELRFCEGHLGVITWWGAEHNEELASLLGKKPEPESGERFEMPRTFDKELAACMAVPCEWMEEGATHDRKGLEKLANRWKRARLGLDSCLVWLDAYLGPGPKFDFPLSSSGEAEVQEQRDCLVANYVESAMDAIRLEGAIPPDLFVPLHEAHEDWVVFPGHLLIWDFIRVNAEIQLDLGSLQLDSGKLDALFAARVQQSYQQWREAAAGILKDALREALCDLVEVHVWSRLGVIMEIGGYVPAHGMSKPQVDPLKCQELYQDDSKTDPKAPSVPKEDGGKRVPRPLRNGQMPT